MLQSEMADQVERADIDSDDDVTVPVKGLRNEDGGSDVRF